MYPLLLWVLLGALAITQAAWILRDARRRGEGYVWLWGFFGLLNVPSSLVVYILVTRHDNTRCPQCGKAIPRRSMICPYCGAKKEEDD
jgi:hypothetical protein